MEMSISKNGMFGGIAPVLHIHYPTSLEIRKALDMGKPMNLVAVVDDNCLLGRKVLGIILLALGAIIELEYKITLLLATDEFNPEIIYETLPNKLGLPRSAFIVRDVVYFNHVSPPN